MEGTTAAEALCVVRSGDIRSFSVPASRMCSLLSIQIEEKLPQLKQFRNNWATEFLVKENFNGHKGYSRRRGRQIARRVFQRRQHELLEGEASGSRLAMEQDDNDAAQREETYIFEHTDDVLPDWAAAL
jgi:hypothetical protein